MFWFWSKFLQLGFNDKILLLQVGNIASLIFFHIDVAINGKKIVSDSKIYQNMFCCFLPQRLKMTKHKTCENENIKAMKCNNTFRKFTNTFLCKINKLKQATFIHNISISVFSLLFARRSTPMVLLTSNLTFLTWH